MHIVTVGVDHTTAPLALRERLACTANQISQLLSVAQQITRESVLLSTCNRVEIYALCQDAVQGCSDLLHLFSEERQIAYDELEAHSYSYIDEQAVTHLFGVASGLYSLIPGEPQIQGQVVDALEVAQRGGFAGPVTSALFRAAVVTGKRARSETHISRNAASLSHVAVQLTKRLMEEFTSANVLLVGSGKMSELAARNLRDNGAGQLVLVNRTQAHAQELAESLQARIRPFAELTDALVDADVVISSTTAPHALITIDLIQQVLSRRQGRSLLLIDLAVPRDVVPEVAEFPGVHLYNIDDLQSEVENGIQQRLVEAERVHPIIAQEVQEFERWLASLSVVDTISDLRKHANTIRQQELARTLRQLSPTLSEQEAAAIQELTNRLMNKLLHMPTLQLKDAAAAGQGHIYAEATRYLFGLEEKADENTYRNACQPLSHDADANNCPEARPAVAQS